MRYNIIVGIIIIVFVTIGMVALGFSQEYRPGRDPETYRQRPFDEGPFNDEIFGAVSTDGINFTILSGPFFKHASVPDVLELTQDCKAGRRGTLLLYFVDFSDVRGPGSEGISMAHSSDGVNWSGKQEIIIEGRGNRGAAVDPSVVQLEDGRIRMFFFASEITEGDPGKSEGDHKICSAISEDGVYFQADPGINFQMPFITDPEVLRVGEEWLMFLSRGQETLLARSRDGSKFTLDDNFYLNIGGVPGAVVLPDGNVRIFATGRGGIVSARFDPDSALAPIIESGTRVSQKEAMIVADPACLKRLDGNYYLIFKRKPIKW